MLSTMGKPMHIFLVDDDADDRMLFQEAMTEISPETKLSLAEGCNMLTHLQDTDKEMPDLILLDLNMPGLNGFECLDEIKKHMHYCNIPVLIYSTTANPDQVKKIYKKGASLYMQKPSSYDGIKILLHKLLHIDVVDYSKEAISNNIVLSV